MRLFRVLVGLLLAVGHGGRPPVTWEHGQACNAGDAHSLMQVWVHEKTDAASTSGAEDVATQGKEAVEESLEEFFEEESNATRHTVGRYLDNNCQRLLPGKGYSLVRVLAVPGCFNLVRGAAEGKSFLLECGTSSGQIVKSVFKEKGCGGAVHFKRPMRWGFFTGKCNHQQLMQPPLNAADYPDCKKKELDEQSDLKLLEVAPKHRKKQALRQEAGRVPTWDRGQDSDPDEAVRKQGIEKVKQQAVDKAQKVVTKALMEEEMYVDKLEAEKNRKKVQMSDDLELEFALRKERMLNEISLAKAIKHERTLAALEKEAAVKEAEARGKLELVRVQANFAKQDAQIEAEDKLVTSALERLQHKASPKEGDKPANKTAKAPAGSDGMPEELLAKGHKPSNETLEQLESEVSLDNGTMLAAKVREWNPPRQPAPEESKASTDAEQDIAMSEGDLEESKESTDAEQDIAMSEGDLEEVATPDADLEAPAAQTPKPAAARGQAQAPSAQHPKPAAKRNQARAAGRPCAGGQCNQQRGPTPVPSSAAKHMASSPPSHDKRPVLPRPSPAERRAQQKKEDSPRQPATTMEPPSVMKHGPVAEAENMTAPNGTIPAKMSDAPPANTTGHGVATLEDKEPPAPEAAPEACDQCVDHFNKAGGCQDWAAAVMAGRNCTACETRLQDQCVECTNAARKFCGVDATKAAMKPPTPVIQPNATNSHTCDKCVDHFKKTAACLEWGLAELQGRHCEECEQQIKEQCGECLLEVKEHCGGEAAKVAKNQSKADMSRIMRVKEGEGREHVPEVMLPPAINPAEEEKAPAEEFEAFMERTAVQDAALSLLQTWVEHRSVEDDAVDEDLERPRGERKDKSKGKKESKKESKKEDKNEKAPEDKVEVKEVKKDAKNHFITENKTAPKKPQSMEAEEMARFQAKRKSLKDSVQKEIKAIAVKNKEKMDALLKDEVNRDTTERKEKVDKEKELADADLKAAVEQEEAKAKKELDALKAQLQKEQDAATERLRRHQEALRDIREKLEKQEEPEKKEAVKPKEPETKEAAKPKEPVKAKESASPKEPVKAKAPASPKDGMAVYLANKAGVSLEDYMDRKTVVEIPMQEESNGSSGEAHKPNSNKSDSSSKWAADSAADAEVTAWLDKMIVEAPHSRKDRRHVKMDLDDLATYGIGADGRSAKADDQVQLKWDSPAVRAAGKKDPSALIGANATKEAVSVLVETNATKEEYGADLTYAVNYYNDNACTQTAPKENDAFVAASGVPDCFNVKVRSQWARGNSYRLDCKGANRVRQRMYEGTDCTGKPVDERMMKWGFFTGKCVNNKKMNPPLDPRDFPECKKKEFPLVLNTNVQVKGMGM